ncbi:MAG TPA: SEL1-like repeat protein [Sphingomonas sp.]
MTAAVLALLLLTGCGAARDYMGIDLRRAPATPSQKALQDTARFAQSGSKADQLTLGRVFEDGRGVPRDLDRACILYRAAATTTGGTIYIYQPKIGNSPGRVVPMTTPLSPGLAAARERLDALAYRAATSDLATSDCLKAAKR